MTVRTPEKIHNLSVLVEKTLLDNYTPPAIIIDSRGNVRYIHGKVSRFLQHPKGQVSGYNAFEMAREGLKIHLITTMRKMRPDSEAVRKEVRIGQDGQAVHVWVTIAPMMKKETPGLYVVLFEEPREESDGGAKLKKPASGTGSRVAD